MFDAIPGLDAAVRTAYLARLGLDAEPPSADALARLVQRQVERVPYETLWIQAGERWSTDPFTAARRIAESGRGGYCYHLNGALGLLLRSLGYAVRGHVGGVHAGERTADEMGNHLVLTVSGLPSAGNQSGVWYVDTGLGDAIHDPLPLVPGVYDQYPFRLTLEDEGAGRWHLTHDPAGGFVGMAWSLAPARLDDFTDKHTRLSTSPESGFVQVPMAERRDATGVEIVRGLMRSRIGDGAFTAEPLVREADWFDTLADVFGIRFGPGSLARERLWSAALAAHRAWEAANRPQGRSKPSVEPT
ncbi:MAG: N-hydroxyarylamine O-acetyltransferase [Pseudonocardiales bacterium]|nr:N-hydroxyarylamine O-acetyltransferase [Pseudonocardiales bacterium]